MSSPAASLPVDLLHVILERITAVDFIRFGAVCRSWRSAVSLFRTAKSDDLRRLKPQFPWLMFYVSGEPESRYFYSFPEGKVFHFHLPQIANHDVFAASCGYLITIDRTTADLHALNPLTGAQIPLPPASMLPGVLSVGRDSLGQIHTYHFGNGINHFPCTVDYMVDCYYQRAIVSPSTHAVAVICDRWRQVVFVRPGDSSWTPFVYRPKCVTPFVDIVFHKGKLCVIDHSRRLMAFDLDYPLIPSVVLTDRFNYNPFQLTNFYLVVSPSGDDLFFMIRNFHSDEIEIETTHFDVYVFKMDDGGECNWEEANNVGELMMFVGINGSMALSSRDLQYARNNIVCYAGNYSRSVGICPNVLFGDIGMFDLGSRTTEPLDLHCELLQLKRPRAMWFSPVL